MVVYQKNISTKMQKWGKFHRKFRGFVYANKYNICRDNGY